MSLLTPSKTRRITFSLRSLRLGALVTLLVSSGALVGCGPFGYIGKVSQKTVDAFEKAQEADAETYAPYEYWAAKAYLDRARVMMTYSEYERAFDYGSRAQQLAEAATRKAQRVKEAEAQVSQETAAKGPESAGQPPRPHPAAGSPRPQQPAARPTAPAPSPQAPAASPPPRPKTAPQQPSRGRSR